MTGSLSMSQGVCHRDLKPENILLDSTGEDPTADPPIVKICDFGFSKVNPAASARP